MHPRAPATLAYPSYDFYYRIGASTAGDDPFNRPRRMPKRFRVEPQDGGPLSAPDFLLRQRKRKLGRSGKEIQEFLPRWKDGNYDEWVREADLPPALVRRFL